MIVANSGLISIIRICSPFFVRAEVIILSQGMVWSGCTTPSITMLDFFPMIAAIATNHFHSINSSLTLPLSRLRRKRSSSDGLFI
jgi:hypothetical protein